MQMKHTLLFVSCLSLGLAAAGCGSSGEGGFRIQSGPQARAARPNDCLSGFVREDLERSAAKPKFRGAAVGNYNKGYVDGANAAAFFNKGRPMTDEQVNRLIEIGRRQGDPTGLLGLPGYPDGYRTGAKHATNPYSGQMTSEQVAQVRKAQGRGKESAEASAR
jgi:hypothetical protein